MNLNQEVNTKAKIHSEVVKTQQIHPALGIRVIRLVRRKNNQL